MRMVCSLGNTTMRRPNARTDADRQAYACPNNILPVPQKTRILTTRLLFYCAPLLEKVRQYRGTDVFQGVAECAAGDQHGRRARHLRAGNAT